MDPDVALSNIREQVSSYFADASDYDEAELLHSLHDLDEWLSKGGFLPAAWQQNRSPEPEQSPHACGCGFPILFVSEADDTYGQVLDNPDEGAPGHWEHDAAPHLWGDDHDAEPS